MLTLLLALAASAGTTHELEMAAGAGGLFKTDRLMSPLPYSGAMPSVDLGWSPRGDRDTNKVVLSLAIGGLRSGPAYDFQWDERTVTTDATAVTAVELQYAYGRQIHGGAWTLDLGGTVANHVEDLGWAYGFTGPSAYLGIFEAAPWAWWRFEPGKRHALELEGWLPLFAWIARNPWAVHDDDYIWNNRDNNALLTIGRYIGDGSMRTWNDYQAAHGRVTYRLNLNDTWALVARARVDWFHFTEPDAIEQWNVGLGLGARGRF